MIIGIGGIKRVCHAAFLTLTSLTKDIPIGFGRLSALVEPEFRRFW
jgi:hypothetical protein